MENLAIVFETIIVFLVYLTISYNESKEFLVETRLGNALMIVLFIALLLTIITKTNARFYAFIILLIMFGELTYYNSKKEGFFYYNNEDRFTDNAENSVNNFRQKYCEDNQLMHKGMRVKNENAEHVFPEINYENRICNPCDVNCELKIIEEDNNVLKEELHVSTLV
jgi:predicted membrane protein